MAIATLLPLFAPDAASATVRYVAPTTAECGSLSPCYTSIQTAINDSASNDSIQIQASDTSYVEHLTLPADLTADFSITIQGTETARTVLSGGGSGTIITADNAVLSVGTLTLNIWNVTITDAANGIQASNKIAARIKNSVFHDLTGTAVTITNPQSSVEITNNTFYKNGTGVSRDTTIPTVTNNIFSTNTVAINAAGSTANLSTNAYSNNGDDATATREASAVTGNLSFVSSVGGDFHLQAGATCCIDTGDTSAGNDSIDGSSPDIGAYGGSQSDTIPFLVSGVILSSPVSGTITVTWTPNLCYQVQGYAISYGTTKGVYGTSVTAPGLSTSSKDVTGLVSGAAAPTGAPNIYLYRFASNSFELFWDVSAVSGATGYEVRYNFDTAALPSTTAWPTVDVGNTTYYQLSGLANGTYYYIVVVPYAQASYYFIVQASYDPALSSKLSSPSTEVPISLGSKAYGVDSNSIHDFPEAVLGFPNVTSKGCFIATAAYDGADTPEVRVLRAFRDRFLVTNAAGRAFVRWYYEHGPAAAVVVNEHPWSKPLVRAALLPAIGCARFMTGTTMMEKAAILLALFTIAGWYAARKRAARGGEVR